MSGFDKYFSVFPVWYTFMVGCWVESRNQGQITQHVYTDIPSVINICV